MSGQDAVYHQIARRHAGLKQDGFEATDPQVFNDFVMHVPIGFRPQEIKDFERLVDRISAEDAAARESQLRQLLIAAGWTPPGGAP